MRSKSGLPPYDAGVHFILQVRNGKLWPPRDVHTVRCWKVTQMLAYMYGMSNTEVAKDIVDRALILEEGDPYVDQRQRHDPDEGHPGDRAAAGRR